MGGVVEAKEQNSEAKLRTTCVHPRPFLKLSQKGVEKKEVSYNLPCTGDTLRITHNHGAMRFCRGGGCNQIHSIPLLELHEYARFDVK